MQQLFQCSSFCSKTTLYVYGNHSMWRWHWNSGRWWITQMQSDFLNIFRSNCTVSAYSKYILSSIKDDNSKFRTSIPLIFSSFHSSIKNVICKSNAAWIEVWMKISASSYSKTNGIILNSDFSVFLIFHY